MANPEHLETLRKGVIPWNAWRQSNPTIKPMLEGADLSGENLRYANLDLANLRDAKLRKVDLRSATLKDADLEVVDLQRAYLRGAVLDRASLRHADIRGTDLNRARLVGADLSQSALLGANFRGANLSEADFNGAVLYEAIFGSTNLSRAHLEGCKHLGRSTIDLRTIELSGALPLAFLRGCGLPDRLIDYLPAFRDEAIQYYSCFISYSTHDQEFAERLHADLQAKGVRCWFASHDIKGGLKIHVQIDDAIQLHDKLLLILSEHSMSSNWVKTEIANARQREEREKKSLLFPITLAPMEEVKRWKLFDADLGVDAARVVREYFIPDFSKWKEHDSYQAALQRLVKDLKAG